MVYTVIVTYNGARWIRKCLESIRQSRVPVKCVVVDNCSTDDTVKIINRDFQDIIFIQSKQNVGFGKGNNIGIKYAMEHGCDAVFLLNQDAWIESDTIGNLIKHHDEGILSPIHMNGDGDDLQSNFKEYSLRIPELYRDAILGQKAPAYETSFVNAAAWYIPRFILEKIGGFNPIFFYRGEDNNYIDRAHYFGIKQYIITDAVIYHDADKRPKRNVTLHDLKTEYLQNCLSLSDDGKKNVKTLLGYCRRMMIRSLLHFDLNGMKMYYLLLRFAADSVSTIEENIQQEKAGMMF